MHLFYLISPFLKCSWLFFGNFVYFHFVIVVSLDDGDDDDDACELRANFSWHFRNFRKLFTHSTIEKALSDEWFFHKKARRQNATNQENQIQIQNHNSIMATMHCSFFPPHTRGPIMNWRIRVFPNIVVTQVRSVGRSVSAPLSSINYCPRPTQMWLFALWQNSISCNFNGICIHVCVCNEAFTCMLVWR